MISNNNYQLEERFNKNDSSCCFNMTEKNRKRQQLQQEMLIHHFPNNSVKTVSILLFLLGITAIALQIILIIYKSQQYTIPVGFWTGGILIVASIATISLSKLKFKYSKKFRLTVFPRIQPHGVI